MDAKLKALIVVRIIKANETANSNEFSYLTASMVESLTDDERIEINEALEAKGFKGATPRNLSFNYQTQRWLTTAAEDARVAAILDNQV